MRHKSNVLGDKCIVSQTWAVTFNHDTNLRSLKRSDDEHFRPGQQWNINFSYLDPPRQRIHLFPPLQFAFHISEARRFNRTESGITLNIRFGAFEPFWGLFGEPSNPNHTRTNVWIYLSFWKPNKPPLNCSIFAYRAKTISRTPWDNPGPPFIIACLANIFAPLAVRRLS